MSVSPVKAPLPRWWAISGKMYLRKGKMLHRQRVRSEGKKKSVRKSSANTEVREEEGEVFFQVLE